MRVVFCIIILKDLFLNVLSVETVVALEQCQSIKWLVVKDTVPFEITVFVSLKLSLLFWHGVIQILDDDSIYFHMHKRTHKRVRAYGKF